MDISQMRNTIPESESVAARAIHIARIAFAAIGSDARNDPGGILSPFDHALKVGYELSYASEAEEVIAAGILHRVPELTEVPISLIRTECGSRVATYVQRLRCRPVLSDASKPVQKILLTSLRVLVGAIRRSPPERQRGFLERAQGQVELLTKVDAATVRRLREDIATKLANVQVGDEL